MKKETERKRIRSLISDWGYYIYWNTCKCMLIGAIASAILSMIVIGVLLFIEPQNGVKEVFEYPETRYRELEVAIKNFDLEDDSYKEYLDKLDVKYSVTYSEENGQEGFWKITLLKNLDSTLKINPMVEIDTKNLDFDKNNIEIIRNYGAEEYKSESVKNIFVVFFILTAILFAFFMLLYLIVYLYEFVARQIRIRQNK